MDAPIYKDLNASTSQERYIKAHYPEFWSYLIETYSGLTFPEMIYWYYNNITERPVCKTCGGPVKFINSRQGYREYCCSKCVDKAEVESRKRKTCLEHYGVTNPMKSEEVKQKLKDNNIAKYGVDNPSKSDTIKAKLRKTNNERYGGDSPMVSEEIREKSSKTIMERYGVPWNCMRDEARQYSNDSGPNRQFAQLLDDNNIIYQREFHIGHRSYDFKIGDVLVEVDPIATHNSTWGIHGRSATDINYHYDKSQLARENNYHCIHIWDWDDPRKILYMLQPKTRIGARQCVIKDVDKKEADKFLNNYHIQGTCKGQDVRLGLYYNDELVELMTFGKPRYNKHYTWELLRLCVHPRYNVLGGSQRLFKHFGQDSIVSYCDNSKFDGGVYERLGFVLSREPHPSRHWYNGHRHITDNLLRQRGFDMLFGTDYGKGTSNDELMLKHGFVELWDCGQTTYTYIKKEDLV